MNKKELKLWLRAGSLEFMRNSRHEAGGEYDTLTSLPESVISRVRWIIGELHGVKDHEFLGYLSQWFDLGFKKSINKPINKSIYVFNARNKRFAELL